ncbi:MAG: response regulator [Candidatus Magasanikbacteria bacterium]|nr:response regulator [Candidatus Magasanikbacteria bacterium]
MPSKKVKILLIEDDPDQVYLYSTKFQLEGLNMVTAKNGVEGLALVKKEKPDLILLDIVMEEMDGIEVLKNLKKDNGTRDIPVVILTNLAKKELLDQSKKLGAIGFWSKSEVLPQDIVDRVKNILKVKKYD